MELVIIVSTVLVIFAMGLLSVPEVQKKKEQKRQRDAWQNHLAMLELASIERAKNPENFKGFQVKGVGTDGIYRR